MLYCLLSTAVYGAIPNRISQTEKTCLNSTIVDPPVPIKDSSAAYLLLWNIPL